MKTDEKKKTVVGFKDQFDKTHLTDNCFEAGEISQISNKDWKSISLGNISHESNMCHRVSLKYSCNECPVCP